MEKKFHIVKNEQEIIDIVAKDPSGNVCNGVECGIYCKEFLVKNRIIFDERLAYAEDIMFNFDVTLCGGGVFGKFDCACYNYRYNSIRLQKDRILKQKKKD